MKTVLTIATLAFAGVAGIAYAQNVDPYEPTDDDIATSAREIYIAQGPSGPDYLAEDELRLLKRDARRVCGDKPDSMLDLVAWKVYRQCVFIESDGRVGPYYPYERYAD
jgi:hypothetical protein